MEPRVFTELIKQCALQLQFDGCGIARAQALGVEEGYLTRWLQNGFHARMHYMAKNREKRMDPTQLLEGAKSVICLLSNYKPLLWQPLSIPQVAAFAYGLDYHVVLKSRLHALQNAILHTWKESNPLSSSPPVMRLFTDTAPIMERAWAARAGLGWIGKSAQLISPQFGPFTFISIILIDMELEYDSPMEARCGACTRCLSACPTGALCAPYTLDASRCISYHTIESKEPCGIDPNNYLFGCDLCLLACPWGKQAPGTTLFPPLPGLLHLTAKEWEEMSADEFAQRFSGSALQRAGLSKIKETLSIFKPFYLGANR